MKTIDIKNTEKLFFTSDNHFGHSNVIKFCDRPWSSVEEMNKGMIELWNSTVPEDGVVICCGDFLWAKDEIDEFAEKLNGKIYLVRGNHDQCKLRDEDSSKKVTWIGDLLRISTKDGRFICSHFPLMAWSGTYNVFGHVHTKKNGEISGSDRDVIGRLRKSQYDVGVDGNDYKPVKYEELMEKLKK